MVPLDFGFLLDALTGWALGLLGLVPFLHTNTLLSALPQASAVLVVVLAFSHLAFESLPGLFFGVPSESQGVTALPGHSLVRSGRGKEALHAVLTGLLGGLVCAVLLAPLFWLAGGPVLLAVRPWTEWLLAGIVVVALAVDGARPRHAAAFLGFGLLGVLAFGLPLKEPLFPLLSGLFGLPAVYFMGRLEPSVGGPRADVAWFWVAAGSLLGAFSVFLPAVSPSFLTALALLFLPMEPVAALVVSAAVSSSRLVFDFLGVLILHTARSAPAALWRQSGISAFDGLVLLSAGFGAFVLAWLLVALAWRAWLRRASGIPLPLLGAGLFCGVVAIAWLLDGPWGLFVLAWAAAASVLAQRASVPRKYALGCLMVPAVLHAWVA